MLGKLSGEACHSARPAVNEDCLAGLQFQRVFDSSYSGHPARSPQPCRTRARVEVIRRHIPLLNERAWRIVNEAR